MDESIVRKEILNRLKTIKGHLNGIEKMVEEGKSCDEVLLQMAAVRSSIEKAGLMLLEEHAADCLAERLDVKEGKEQIDRIIRTAIKFMK